MIVFSEDANRLKPILYHGLGDIAASMMRGDNIQAAYELGSLTGYLRGFYDDAFEYREEEML